jgi:hypothetical protein
MKLQVCTMCGEAKTLDCFKMTEKWRRRQCRTCLKPSAEPEKKESNLYRLRVSNILKVTHAPPETIINEDCPQDLVLLYREFRTAFDRYVGKLCAEVSERDKLTDEVAKFPTREGIRFE